MDSPQSQRHTLGPAQASRPERFSIESGHFVFTLMPSLRCDLNCPHCYLSLKQRRESEIMSPERLALSAHKVADYYRAREIPARIEFYWYGGEPTQMGQDYFLRSFALLADAFPAAEGFETRHTVLSSLINVEASWFPIFKEHCGGLVQSSFDGLMRGKGYLRQWEKQARAVIASGLELSTITVVNNEILEAGPEATLDYLTDLGISETSWLPFMWNEQNDSGAYKRFAPTMRAWSTFMIRLTEHWRKLSLAGKKPPEIGQAHFILTQRARANNLSNIAGQTLFLMPNGDFSLPDYKNGWQEFLQPFGNIFNSPFEDILASPERRAYLRKQALRNNNPECLACPLSNRCVMEFWKTNRPEDDCFGGAEYVRWLEEWAPKQGLRLDGATLY